MIVKIYTLTDPIDGKIKYVGRTQNDLKIRLYSHLNPKAKHTNKAKWIYELRNKNLKPIIEPLEEFEMIKNQENWDIAHSIEKYWIEQFEQWGFPLLNHIDKGSGYIGKCWNDNQFEKMNKKVFQYNLKGELIGEFKSIKEASIKTKCTYGSVRSCLSGHTKTASGEYIFSFTEILNFEKPIRKNARTVFQYDLEGNLIKKYIGNKEIIEDGFKPKNIYECANGNIKTYKTFVWSFKLIKKFKKPQRKEQIGKTIYQYTKEGYFLKEWKDTKEVALTLNIRKKGITQVAIGQKKSFKGFIWSYEKYQDMV